LSPAIIAVYSTLIAMVAVLSADASAEPQSARLTMTGLKYSFDKIPENWNVLLSMTLGFSAEIIMIISICLNIAGGPMLRAASLIGAALYSPALLNKLFTILSMAARIKVDLKRRTVLNISLVIMFLFCGMAAAMLHKW
jgi:hypothetical protein